MIYALDTNIISYLLKKDPAVIKRYRQENDKGNECMIPPVAYYEIKRGLLTVGAVVKTKLFDELCKQFGVGKMDTPAWDEAARLYAKCRKAGQPIEDADLFIAAFCIVNGYTLVTNNAKHFENIDGLKIANWVS